MMNIAHTKAPAQKKWDALHANSLQAFETRKAFERGDYAKFSELHESIREPLMIIVETEAKPEAREALDALGEFYRPVEDKYKELLEIECDAAKAMLAHPAPNMGAVLAKVAYIEADETWDWFDSETLFKWILSDLRRLV